MRLPYAVVGGIAVAAWGIVRATRDVDLYVPLDEPDARRRLRAALESRAFHVPAMEEELDQLGVCRSRSRESVFLDLFNATGPLGSEILNRRKQLEIEGRTIAVVAPEELIALKAYSDRPRDFEDLVGLHRVLGERIDGAAVDRWAAALDESIGSGEVRDRLRRARVAAGWTHGSPFNW